MYVLKPELQKFLRNFSTKLHKLSSKLYPTPNTPPTASNFIIITIIIIVVNRNRKKTTIRALALNNFAMNE